jgi:hypothetical protein
MSTYRSLCGCTDGSISRTPKLENAMKRTTYAIIAGISLAMSAAAGANERQLEAVKVSSGTSVDCTPPNDSPLCSAWHEEIRRNFTKREIGMLFGAATSYPEFHTSYEGVKARYDRLQGEFAATWMSSDTVASK